MVLGSSTAPSDIELNWQYSNILPYRFLVVSQFPPPPNNLSHVAYIKYLLIRPPSSSVRMFPYLFIEKVFIKKNVILSAGFRFKRLHACTL